MSISDFEQSLWELALLINPTHLANITTSKLNSYYQDTILDMRKVVLVQNLFNDIYNNWTDHQIRYQQNRRRQIENGEITEQQLLEEESEENESEIEYISDEEGQEMTDEERYDSIEFSKQDVDMIEDNKENIDTNNGNGNVIIANDNTVITLPVRKDSVSHKSNGKPIKKIIVESQANQLDNIKNEPAILPTPPLKSNKDINIEKNTIEAKANVINNNVTPSKEMKKKPSKTDLKEKKNIEQKENVKPITLDFSGKESKSEDNNNNNNNNKSSNANTVTEEQEITTKKSKKEHSRRKKIEREPRKDSLKATTKLSNEKNNEVLKELQKSGVIQSDKINNEESPKKTITKSDSVGSLDEKTESSINSLSSASNSSNNSSFVIRSFNIPSQQQNTQSSSTTPTVTAKSFSKLLPAKQDPIPVRKSSSISNYKKNKPSYRLSDKEVSIKDKYNLNKNEEKEKTKSKTTEKSKKSTEPGVRLRPKKIPADETGMPPAMQRRSMDELLFQFADVMDIVSLIPHIVGDDDLLGNDLTFNSSNLNSKVQTKDSNGNVIEETPRRRPSRAPTPPPTVVSNGKEYEVYSIPSERHQKYIKKKEEMEKQNKRRSSLKFEYHGFEDLKRQQELAGYDTTGDVPVTERIAKEKSENSSKNNNSNSTSTTSTSTTTNNNNSNHNHNHNHSNSKSSSSSNSKTNYKRNNSSSSSGCGAAMKMDVLSGCMSNSNSHNSSSKNSSSKRASRFINSITKSKSKSGSKDKDKEKEKMSSSNNNSNSSISSINKENHSSNSSSKNYLTRRKSSDKSSSNSSSNSPMVRSYQRYILGNSSPETSSSQSSPTLSSVSNSSNGSKSSVKKSYSSSTLSMYDLPHMSSLSAEGSSSSRRYGGGSSSSNGERGSSSRNNLPTSKSNPGIYESMNPSSSKHHRQKKATDHKSSSTSEIDKFFDNVFRIDWTPY